MSKPKSIAFSELRVLADQSRPLVPMLASASAKPRNGWYRELTATAPQGAAQGGRGAMQRACLLAESAPPWSSEPTHARAPVRAHMGDDAPPALLVVVEQVVSQPGPLDANESRRRWQPLSELPPLDAAPPVSAIARSISQASALLDVCALVVELCGGERQRPAGTWEATLPLAQQGLGGTLLRLSLSPESLALRFVCDEPSTLDMLRPRLDELRRQLLQQLAPPLELSVDIELL